MSTVSRGAARASESPDQRAELRALAEEVAARAVQAGADGAEVLVRAGSELEVKVRLGKPELVHEARSRGLGLRVVRDQRSAVTYTSDFSPDALARFIDSTIELSQLSEPDELGGLPDRSEVIPPGTVLPDLGMWDEAALKLTAKDALEQALAAEAAAMAYSNKVTNSDGASFSRGVGSSALALADRQGLLFSGASRGTYQALTAEAICDDEGGKKRNASYWTADCLLDRMLAPEVVGRTAAERAVKKLGAEKIPTAELPVVFHPDAARALLRLLAQVISGGSIYRKASYLAERIGTEVASPLVTVVDDPLLPTAPGSRLYDGEGLPVRRNVVVEGGVLKSFLLDTYSARKLGLRSNGCAGRGVGSSAHVTTSNFVLQPGALSQEEILKDLERGLFVTEMMGFGFNAVTGDFSRGAGGFLIENGQLTRPVSEVTISANFDELLKRIDAIGNDLDRRSATMVSSVRVSRMTVAGR